MCERSEPIPRFARNDRQSRRADLGFMHRLDGVEMLRRGEAAGANVVSVLAKGPLDLEVEIRVAPDEARPDLPDEAAEDVVRDHELAIDVWAGADAVDEQLHALAYVRRRLGRYRLEEHRERAGFL